MTPVAIGWITSIVGGLAFFASGWLFGRRTTATPVDVDVDVIGGVGGGDRVGLDENVGTQPSTLQVPTVPTTMVQADSREGRLSQLLSQLKMPDGCVTLSDDAGLLLATAGSDHSATELAALSAVVVGAAARFEQLLEKRHSSVHILAQSGEHFEVRPLVASSQTYLVASWAKQSPDPTKFIAVLGGVEQALSSLTLSTSGGNHGDSR